MIVKDRMELNGFNRPKFPKLKGHVKVTLHNVHNGKNEIIEGENIVTNAVADIFANNYLGGIDYSKMFPLWQKWFGGVLCYEKFHTNLDADKYYPYAESNNHLVAHAGQAGIDVQHDDDMRAGNPTTSSYIQTENSMKQVWEWGTTHGNGTIRALSLTHTDVGDAGLGGENYKFQNLEPFELIQGSHLPNSNINLVADDNFMAQYDENHGIFFHIGEPSDWVVGDFSASIETTKITVCIRRLPYAKSGLFETMHGRSGYDREFTVEINGVTGFPKLYAQPSFYFDYSTKKLWLFTNNTAVMRWSGVSWDKEHVHCIVIDCENEQIDDEFLITSDTADLVPLCEVRDSETSSPSNYNQNLYQIAGLVKDGNYVYFPTGTGPNGRIYSINFGITGYQKINVASQADQTSISFLSGTTQRYLKSAIKSGDLIINSGMVVNDTGYPCVNQLSEELSYYVFGGVWCYQQQNGRSNLVLPIGAGNQSDTASYSRYIAANKLLHTTKYNLPSAITKTASQSMTVEYTLSEVT